MSSSMPISFALQVQGAEQVKTKINGVSGSMNQLNKSAGTASAAAQPVQRNYQQAALGISAAASSATATVFSFQNLQKSSVAVADAERDVIEKHLAYDKAQAAVNKLIEQGKEGTQQYAFALRELDSKTRDYKTSQEKFTIAQQDASNAQLQFGLSVVPTVLTSVTGLQGAMKGLNFGLTTTGRVGAPTASRGVRQFGFATRLAQLAMGPFGIAMLAIGAAFTAVATNAFGLRDAMDSFAKKVEAIFPVLRPVFDFFRTIASAIFPDTKDETKDMEQQFGTSFANISNEVNRSTSEQTTAMSGLQTSFETTRTVGEENIKALATTVGASSTEIEKAAKRARAAMQSIGASVGPAPSVTTPAATPTVDLEAERARKVERSRQIAESTRIARSLGFGADTDPLGFLRPTTSTGQLDVKVTRAPSEFVKAFGNLIGKGSQASGDDIRVFLDSEQIAAKVERRQKESARSSMLSIT